MRNVLVIFLSFSLVLPSNLALAQNQGQMQNQTPRFEKNVKVLNLAELGSYTDVHIHKDGLTFNYCKQLGSGAFDCSRKLGCRAAGNLYMFYELDRQSKKRRKEMWAVGALDGVLVVGAAIAAIYGAAAAGATAVGSEIIVGSTVVTGEAANLVENSPVSQEVKDAFARDRLVLNRLPYFEEAGPKLADAFTTMSGYVQSRWVLIASVAGVGAMFRGMLEHAVAFFDFRNYRHDAETISYQIYDDHAKYNLDLRSSEIEDFSDRLDKELCAVDQWRPKKN